MSKELRIAVASAIGKPAAVVPVLSDEIAILKFVEADCGAEGFTIDRGQLVAVVWRDGVPCERKRYDIETFGGKG